MIEQQQLIGYRLGLPQGDELLLQVHGIFVRDEAKVAKLADAGHRAPPRPLIRASHTARLLLAVLAVGRGRLFCPRGVRWAPAPRSRRTAGRMASRSGRRSPAARMARQSRSLAPRSGERVVPRSGTG